MKLIVIITFLLLQQEAHFIKGENFSGYIFSENPELFGKYNFTPTENDIYNVEKIISEQLEALNSQRINQFDGCPVIHRKLRKYVRQYIGNIDKNGEQIVYVNFIWKKHSSAQDAGKHIVSVLDGCSYFWNVKVNLNTGKLFELNINGIA